MSIKVRVVQLGRGVIDCEVEAGSTVRGLLSSNGVPIDGMEIRVDGGAAELDHSLSEGDLITVVPLIKGGGRCAPGPHHGRGRSADQARLEDMNARL